MDNDDEHVVSVRGLRKAYAGRTVVDGVDLEVRAGEVLGLIGANGAGKTTTVERFGLAHRHGSAFGGMSGGERQRLFLVLALLNRPRLVILDELTQGLRSRSRRSPSSARSSRSAPPRSSPAGPQWPGSP